MKKNFCQALSGQHFSGRSLEKCLWIRGLQNKCVYIPPINGTVPTVLLPIQDACPFAKSPLSFGKKWSLFWPKKVSRNPKHVSGVLSLFLCRKVGLFLCRKVGLLEVYAHAFI